MPVLKTDNNNFNIDTYFALCNNIKEGVAIIEAESRKFVFCNKSFLQLFGLNSLDDIDINVYRKLRKDKLTAKKIAQREKIIAEKGIFNELVEYTSLKGHSFFGEITLTQHKHQGLKYYLFAINPVDKSFFELASIGILMVNTNGEIVTANPFIIQQFGYSRAELIGKKIEMLIPPRFRTKHVGYRENFVNSARGHHIRTKMDLIAIKKNGQEFPVEVNLDRYPSGGDKYIIAFINDISIRKAAEAEAKKSHEDLEFKIEQRTIDLKETLTQLEISKRELQKVNMFQKALLDNAGAMIIATDENGIITLFNPEAAANLGYHESEVINTHVPILFHDKYEIARKRNRLFDEYRITIKDDFDVLVEKARRNTHEEELYTYIRKDGSTFPVSLTITGIRNSNGNITGFLGIGIDISERKKEEEELRIALEKEKELNELKSRFVSMASHEFRTPLSTVLSSTYLIEKYGGAEDQPKRQIHLQRIISSVNMLTDILNDFLSVGKIEEGKIQVRLTHFSITEQIAATLREIESTLKKQQKIQYHHEGSTEVLLDAALLKHIIMNLVSNASKFSPENSLIEIRSCCKDKTTIIIKDHGIGISLDDQQHLMERFFRGSNAANIQGTGLGLHIVAKYTQLMNGCITWKSELEKGSEFIITLNNKNG
jgi:PAS domain S-box-containing protein